MHKKKWMFRLLLSRPPLPKYTVNIHCKHIWFWPTLRVVCHCQLCAGTSSVLWLPSSNILVRCAGLARTVYKHRTWPYIHGDFPAKNMTHVPCLYSDPPVPTFGLHFLYNWRFPCQKNRTYTVSVYGFGQAYDSCSLSLQQSTCVYLWRAFPYKTKQQSCTTPAFPAQLQLEFPYKSNQQSCECPVASFSV